MTEVPLPGPKQQLYKSYEVLVYLLDGEDTHHHAWV